MNIQDVKNTTSTLARSTVGDTQAARNTGVRNAAVQTGAKDSLILSSDAARISANNRKNTLQTGLESKQTLQDRNTRTTGADNTLAANQNGLQTTFSQKATLQQTPMDQNPFTALSTTKPKTLADLQKDAATQKSMVNQPATTQKTGLLQASQVQKDQTAGLDIAPNGTAQNNQTTVFTKPVSNAPTVNTQLAAEKPSNITTPPTAPDTRAQDNRNKTLQTELFQNAMQAQTGQNPMLDLLG